MSAKSQYTWGAFSSPVIARKLNAAMEEVSLSTLNSQFVP